MTAGLLVELLATQQELTPVDRISARYDVTDVIAPGERWRALLPPAAPGPGQQLAFDVDLDACTGCKSCVAACHSLNGLDAGESWRSVGTLYGVAGGQQYVQTVTAACHHCVEPGCLAGCPVDAYEKDAVTGIVRHLDDQCIGCSYCTLTCPYEVPRYNHRLGIVRKCDMCQGRLAMGEAPACAQACPNGAITVKVVDVAERVATASLGPVVPGAPPSTLTVPTTTYRTSRGVAADVLAADHHDVHPAQAHPPLAIMLVLTQIAVGAFLGDAVLGGNRAPLGLAVGLLAVGASVLHLGRPQYAWRVVIGLRHSWLSREAVAFGAFAGLAAVGALRPSPTLAALTGAAGMVGVACSVAIYAVTGRPWWRARATAFRFATTTAAGGLAVVAATAPRPTVAGMLAAVVAAKLAWEALSLRPPHPREPARHTARLLTGPLAVQVRARYLLGVVGGIALPLATATQPSSWLAVPALVLLTAGELVERSLFFTAATAPRMPGGIA